MTDLRINTAGPETLVVEESEYKSIFMHLRIASAPSGDQETDEDNEVGVGLYRDQAEQLRDWLNRVLS